MDAEKHALSVSDNEVNCFQFFGSLKSIKPGSNNGFTLYKFHSIQFHTDNYITQWKLVVDN